MADEQTIKVTVDGKEHTVPLPEGLVTVEDVNAGYVPILRHTKETKRLKDLLEKVRSPEDLLEDEEFLQRIATEKADVLAPLMGLKKDDPEALQRAIEAAKKRWKAEELDPIVEDRDRQAAGSRRGRQFQLRTVVGEAQTALGVHEQASKAVKGMYGTTEDHERRVAYDEEHDGWFCVDPAKPVDDEGRPNFLPTGKPGKDKAPWRTVEEDLVEVKAGGDHDVLFRADGGRGAGYQGPGGHRGAKTGKERLEEAAKAGNEGEFWGGMEQAAREGAVKQTE